MDVEINYLAVFLAMLSSMVVGAIWYAKSVFGNDWAKLAKVDLKKVSQNSYKPILVTAFVSLVTAFVLAHFAFFTNRFFGNSFLQDSLTTAFWLWVGLTATRFITHDAFERRPAKLTAINLGNELVTLVIMGLIIGLMGY